MKDRFWGTQRYQMKFDSIETVVLNKWWYKPDRFQKPIRFFEANHYLSSTTNESRYQRSFPEPVSEFVEGELS